MPGSIRVRVVYALADRQSVVELVVAAGSTVAQAVEASGLLRRFAEIASQPLQCAIFGRVVSTAATLAEADRVEILRPLLVDPKESRRQVAAQSRQALRNRTLQNKAGQNKAGQNKTSQKTR